MRYVGHELKGERGGSEKELNVLDKLGSIKTETDELNDSIDNTGNNLDGDLENGSESGTFNMSSKFSLTGYFNS